MSENISSKKTKERKKEQIEMAAEQFARLFWKQAQEELRKKNKLETSGHFVIKQEGTEKYASGDRSSKNKWNKEIGDVIKKT